VYDKKLIDCQTWSLQVIEETVITKMGFWRRAARTCRLLKERNEVIG
jgi:hypothetical protein